MIQYGRSTGNSAMEIILRQKQAAVNRNRIRLAKETRVLEHHYEHNERKLNSLQRSINLLLGQDPYPRCSRKDALFEYNCPGFYYKRDGEPRLMYSLLESKTRRIVEDLEGNEGLSKGIAVNVVSDTPQLAEVLSNPELVQILCELRNTSAIMANETLYSQFATALQGSSVTNLMRAGYDGPREFLKQYRKSLIQEFFEVFKTEAEMRYYYSRLRNTDKGIMSYEDHRKSSFNTFLQHAIPSTIATKASQESVPGKTTRRIGDRNSSATGSLNFRKPVPERKEGWRFKKFMEDLSNLPPILSEVEIGLLTNRILSLHETSKQGGPETAKIKKPEKRELDGFVRDLITKVQRLDAMGQNFLAFRRKRPDKHTAKVNSPFIKLLEKQSLATSLTDDDLRQILSEEMDDDFIQFYKAPENQQAAPSRFEMVENSRTRPDQPTAKEQKIPPGKRVSFGDSGSRSSSTIGSASTTCETSPKHHRRSCIACKEKVRQACSRVQNRDAISRKVKDAYLWNVPVIANWPHEYRDPNAVRPQSLKSVTIKSESNLKKLLKKETLAKSAYLLPPEQAKFIKKAKPISTQKLPIKMPAEFSVFPGRPSRSSIPVKKGVSFERDFGSYNELKKAPPSKYSKGRLNGTGSIRNRIISLNSNMAEKGLGSSRREHEAQTSLPLLLTPTTLQRTSDTWTLKVSKIDIMRLRHELETESVRDKMAEFEKKFLSTETIAEA